MDKAFSVLEEQLVYQGFFSLIRYRFRHTLYRGGWSEVLDRELFHRGRCVAVIPYDPKLDRVVLIEQFRVGAMKTEHDPWLLEIVAGAIEEGEEPPEVAHREALEEAGCTIDRLLPIYEFFTTPGGCSEKLTLFCGIVDASAIGGHYGLAEEQEDIRVRVVSYDEAMALLAEGKIDSAIPIVALQWLALNRDGLRRRYGGSEDRTIA
ncbi:MAG: NUDIX domain-containing protein [Gammaproteobacteria bacterium]|nr:NUDIX domain-containing protein [Gammaproteobacteria bacterium]